jgi:hypothetical protein
MSYPLDREAFEQSIRHEMLHDHAPYPGPGYWEWKCMLCEEDVRDHGNIFQRWLWRRRKANELSTTKGTHGH